MKKMIAITALVAAVLGSGVEAGTGAAAAAPRPTRPVSEGSATATASTTTVAGPSSWPTDL